MNATVSVRYKPLAIKWGLRKPDKAGELFSMIHSLASSHVGEIFNVVNSVLGAYNSCIIFIFAVNAFSVVITLVMSMSFEISLFITHILCSCLANASMTLISACCFVLCRTVGVYRSFIGAAQQRKLKTRSSGSFRPNFCRRKSFLTSVKLLS